ncbi:deoxyribose-phosphate aldolase [Bacillus massilinigeriensis]|uniref:deoxyribose-phosphate aldolase n=1 Tax=Bacillus massilionigeriensis TaxID=1805475 RepID=UPI00096B3E42|nr:deoxyribose-phosphate aldolase [Bacillus massilionigeriensis]
MKKFTEKELAQYIDHTILKPYVSSEEIKAICDECREYDFKMIAINSAPVAFCKEQLKDTNVHVGAAISFPLGQTTIETKVAEVRNAIKDGCDEIDYVINITELKNKNYAYIKKEMEEIVHVCREHEILSKVIFENCYLTKEEIEIMSKIALEVGPDFIKTSTGFGTGGATIEDVKLMKSIVIDKVKVKAAGGIRDLQTCLAMIDAGAERIGTSNGVKIIKELRELN